MALPKSTTDVTSTDCHADLTSRSGESPFLGQPFRISLREMGLFLRPRQDEYPITMKPLDSTGWMLSTEPYLHILMEPCDNSFNPWLHFTFGLKGRLSPAAIAAATSLLAEDGKVHEVGPCRGQIEWRTSYNLKQAKITMNQIIMDRMASLIGEPSGDASWFFSRLTPRRWPARLYSSYASGTIGLWVRLF